MAFRTALSRLSRGMVTFIVIDALLVAVFVVLLATTVVGGSNDDAARGPAAATPSASAAASDEPAPAGARDLAAFALPSGNIACTLSDAGARCEIASITFEPPADAACSGEVGHVVTLDAQGVQLPCVEGSGPAVAGPDVPLLEYGFTSSVGGYTCTSATSGVRCLEDATGRGFQLARGAFGELP